MVKITYTIGTVGRNTALSLLPSLAPNIKLYPGSLFLPFKYASVKSECDVICREIEQLLLHEGYALMMVPAHALTTFYRVDAACLQSQTTRGKQRNSDSWWSSLRLLLLASTSSLTQERNHRLSSLVTWQLSFLLLDVTVFCEPTNVSEATRQLLRHLAFNLHNAGLFGIELKPGVGLNFAEEQG